MQSFAKIRFRFESGSNPVGFRFDSTTQFLPNSYPIPTQFPPFILGQIVCSSRFGQMNLSWGEYIRKRTRERLLCHSNQDGLPMDKKIVYSSRFVRVILAKGNTQALNYFCESFFSNSVNHGRVCSFSVKNQQEVRQFYLNF